MILKQLYCWHNGMNEEENLGSLFYGMEFLSLTNIETKRDDLADLVDELFVLQHADPQINPTNAHHRDWVQFAHDGGRTGFVCGFSTHRRRSNWTSDLY